MLSSADSFLFSVAWFLIPAAVILIMSGLYSYALIRRYSKTVNRLYKLNFNSLETERKRVSSDLHDQFASQIIGMDGVLKKLSNKLTEDDSDLIELREQLAIFKLDFYKQLEFLYPKELHSDWNKSVELLINSLCVADVEIILTINAIKTPQPEREVFEPNAPIS
jgi:hypothetical protein